MSAAVGADAELTIATAGHVDHGKTTLVRALTGHDTDRLPAERARGLTIEPGFAPLDLPSGRRVGVVDVPGHERFVRHMVAGASGVDAYLLCVAADDGVMPQTLEHLAVMSLLRVDRGVVAITKCDLAPPERAVGEVLALVGEETAVVPVDARSGAGLQELLRALDRLIAGTVRRTAAGPARLFVDRAFSLPGAGTVVTGTHWGASIAEGERVRALPGGAVGRVRRVEAHGARRDAAHGGRTALNLAGMAPSDAPRGACLVVAGDGLETTTLLDVGLRWLPDAGAPLRTRRRLQAFLGTAEVPATCVLLEGDVLRPGERGYAQLRLERPVSACPGDRIVLRSAAPRTVGGAEVIDAAPARHGRGSGAGALLAVLESPDPAAALAAHLRAAGSAGIPASDPVRALLDAADGVVVGDRAISGATVTRAREAVLGAAAEAIPAATAARVSGLSRGAARALLARMVDDGSLRRAGTALAAADRAPALSPEHAALADLLADAGTGPPTWDELARRTGVGERRLRVLLADLKATGRAVPAGELWFDAAALEAAVGAARAAMDDRPMRLSELRDLWGCGRRHALAIAEHMDRAGVSRRAGEARVPATG